MKLPASFFRPGKCRSSLAEILMAVALLGVSASAVADSCTWTASSEDWSLPANWSCGHVPSTADTAVINSGTPTLNINASIAGLTFAGGDLTTTGNLTVTSAMTWSGGNLHGVGMLRVETGATLLLEGSAHTINGSFVNAGLATWEAGEFDGIGQFVNEGELVLAVDATTFIRLCFASAPGFITNAATGLIRRTGTGEARVYCPFDNAGMVRVESGSLALRGFNATGGSDSGDYQIESAGTLILDGGAPRTMSAETSITGQGRLAVHGAYASLAGNYDVHATRIINVNGNAALNLNADATTDTLEIITGTLGGAGTLTVTEAFAWTGGTMRGGGTTMVALTATLEIAGTATKSLYDTRTLRNDGTGVWSGTGKLSNSSGSLFLNNGSVEVSAAGQDGSGIFFGGTFTNVGTFVLDSGGDSRFASYFHNQGSVQVDSGNLVLSGFNANGGTHSGDYGIAAGAALEFAGGNHTLTDAALIHGNGVVAHSAGGLSNSATIAPGASPGILTWMATNSFAPTAGTVLDIEIGGYAPGSEHDVLVVDGRAAPAGTIQVTLTDSFIPNPNDEIAILTATEGVCRQFDTELLPPGYRLIYYPTEVRFGAGPPNDRIFAHDFEIDPCDT